MTTGAPPTGSDGPPPGPRPRPRTRSLAPDTGWLELPDPDDHPLPREHARSPDVAALLRRTVRWVAITALAYRVVAPPSSVAGYMGAVGPSHAVAVIVVATVVTLATAAFLTALASGRARDLLWSRAFFLADIGVGAALNLWAAASLPARTLDQPFRDVFWYYLIGATGMWVAVHGVRAGLLVVGVSAPLQVAMCLVNGLTLDTHVMTQMLARSLWLVLSIVVGSVILPLLRLGTRLALAEGLHTGQKVEQARLNRAMHDTVLQTLEAIALRAGDEHEAPADPATRAVGTGGSYVSPALAGHLLMLGRADRSGGVATLTEREREILALVADGETDQTIAAALQITVSTVRSHLDRIRDKTGRRRRADLTQLAVERAILPRPRRSP